MSRTYSKSELASLYMPHVATATARRTLARWIAHNKQLTEELAQAGYKKQQILLTPAQVSIIFKFLGEPG